MSFICQKMRLNNLEKFIYIVANVIIRQSGIENFEICAVHIFKDQTRRFWMLISDNIKQLHDIWASTEILQYFYLPLYLHKYWHITTQKWKQPCQWSNMKKVYQSTIIYLESYYILKGKNFRWKIDGRKRKRTKQSPI